MIDVIFFLLVFFMVSTLSMTINRGLPVNLPTAATSQKEKAETESSPAAAASSARRRDWAPR
jgi:biopolymer transport protein ExbD